MTYTSSYVVYKRLLAGKKIKKLRIFQMYRKSIYRDDDYLNAAFVQCCIRGNLLLVIDCVKIGIKSSSAIGIKTSSALGFASWRGHLPIVKFLYANGYQITNWAFEMACEGGNLATVKFLYKHINDIYISELFKREAIIKASQYGNLDIVKYFIKLGWNPTTDYTNYDKNVAIQRACKNGHLHIVRYLLDIIDPIKK